MNTKLTDTQKFRLGNEIAKKYTGQDPAYGIDHHQTIKTKGVAMVKKTSEIVMKKKLSPTIEFFILAIAIVSCPVVFLLIAALLP